MLTIFIRTFIVYIILIVAMRIMGKRQIGELEISELVTTFMLSEIASMPIENHELPVMYAVIPIITLLSTEVFSSIILIKVPKLKNIVSARPSILIRNGKIDQKELEKNRISPEELMCELRAKQCTDPTQVSYAILEKNGKMAVVMKSEYNQPTLAQLSIPTDESGILHLLVIDGGICKNNLKNSGRNLNWLEKELSSISCPMKDIYIFGVDDSGKTLLIRKDSK